MPRKPPFEERRLILFRDQRRKYGARLTFQVQRPEDIGNLENFTLLLDDGTIATIEPGRSLSWESGKYYNIEIVGFPTATDAESAGMCMAQSLLLAAVSLNFGLRLTYHSHEPPTIFDRTVSPGMSMWGELSSTFPQEVVLNELAQASQVPLKDRRLLLSMELFVAAALESNDRAKFVMAVSALEPLAVQESLGSEVVAVVDRLAAQLESETTIPSDIRDSLRGRLLQLKQESVRQALKRLCRTWVPNDSTAWRTLDEAYGLRSELLHEGRPNDLDILLAEKTRIVSNLLRRIYQQAFGYALRAPVAV